MYILYMYDTYVICIYTSYVKHMHVYIHKKTPSHIVFFICRFRFSIHSEVLSKLGAPRNAGILGVPNASGPMTDVEGRKR